MKTRSAVICLLLFGSGLCALVYQTVWLREFRMIFGTSTAATAAVLAIFMAGLGVGSVVLGARVDRRSRPLRFYAQLEFLIATAAALSPLLLWLTRAAYLSLGGAESVGATAAIVIRLILSALVLALPTFLMGGTLPAAGRAIETDSDQGRRKLALVYGSNTLGAVVGVLISTFYLLEHLGNRHTLWVACGVNFLVAGAALALSRSQTSQEITTDVSCEITPAEGPPVRLVVVLIAAWLVGFVFFLMELVWYRMMTPLLGGTTFTFGLILAIALLGIGIGSCVYASWSERIQPTLSGFALTCAEEALFIAAPFALGDRIAVLALLLRPLGAIGFHGHILAWTLVTAIVVLPASIVAGVQFPMLVGLLGKGRQNVGWHTGLAYGANTLGAITGSLAGGFGLLPAISATGAWKISALMLAAFGTVIWIICYRSVRQFRPLLAPIGLTIVAILLLFATGPTAAWRQSPIGAGRGDESFVTSRNTKEEWLREKRRYLVFQKDGIESCVGVNNGSGIAFLINGKPDGNAVLDGPTQVMLGLLGAILQPNATRSLVVGLGTGSTAGWLGAIPSMKQVDVIELERAVLQVAELSASVNRNVLSNPKVRIAIGDAREKLLTTREQYDLIVSEPSNPYRAGIASLYTKDYYEAAAQRIRRGGLFVQWVQAYEVDAPTIRSIYATFSSVFPVVETWQTHTQDLVFVGAKEAIHYDADALRKRISEPPFAEALAKVWRVTDVEGFLARYVANESFAGEMAHLQRPALNTDDRNFIEFSFARTVGRNTGFQLPVLRATAHEHGQDRPLSFAGQVDWERVDDENAEIYMGRSRPPIYLFFNDEQSKRVAAQTAYFDGEMPRALELWRAQPRDAENLSESAMMAHMLAQSGADGAMKYIDKVAALDPSTASMLLGLLRAQQGRLEDATAAFESAYVSSRTDPWPVPVILKRSFPAAADIASRDGTKTLATRLYRALEKPFAANLVEEDRRNALAQIGRILDRDAFSDYTRNVIASFEPDPPWERDFLQLRRDCYRALSDPRAAKADRDLSRFISAEPAPLEPE